MARPSSVLRQGSTYRGTGSDPTLSLGFANSGDLQIELIAPEDDTPSICREFLDSGGHGFYHIAFWASDVLATAKRAAERGWTSVQSGRCPSTTRASVMR